MVIIVRQGLDLPRRRTNQSIPTIIIIVLKNRERSCKSNKVRNQELTVINKKQLAKRRPTSEKVFLRIPNK